MIVQISSHLDLVDLLNFARTSKTMHRVLMSRKYKNIWRTAREAIAYLPQIFPGMSEPAFADLMFGTHCHVRTHRSNARTCTDFISGVCGPPCEQR